MKNVIAVLGMVMAVNPVWSAASEAPMPFELGRTGIEAVRLTGVSVPAPVMNAGSLALMRSDAEIITSQFLNDGTKAARDAWKHAALRAGDGTDIGVDYSIVNLGGSVIAAPVWISVTNPAFRGGEHVKAVLLNYYEGGAAPLIQQTREIDLEYSGNGRYTAEAGKVPLSESHMGYGYNFRQEIAVAVDGKWLKDPVGGSSNFRFKMTRY